MQNIEKEIILHRKKKTFREEEDTRLSRLYKYYDYHSIPSQRERERSTSLSISEVTKKSKVVLLLILVLD